MAFRDRLLPRAAARVCRLPGRPGGRRFFRLRSLGGIGLSLRCSHRHGPGYVAPVLGAPRRPLGMASGYSRASAACQRQRFAVGPHRPASFASGGGASGASSFHLASRARRVLDGRDDLVVDDLVGRDWAGMVANTKGQEKGSHVFQEDPVDVGAVHFQAVHLGLILRARPWAPRQAHRPASLGPTWGGGGTMRGTPGDSSYVHPAGAAVPADGDGGMGFIERLPLLVGLGIGIQDVQHGLRLQLGLGALGMLPEELLVHPSGAAPWSPSRSFWRSLAPSSCWSTIRAWRRPCVRCRR